MSTEPIDQLKLRTPADEESLSRVPLGRPIPKDYLDFIRRSDGAEGFIGDSYLILYPIGDLVEINEAAAIDRFAPGLFIFGSNGGGVSYAFDGRGGQIKYVEIEDMDLGDEEPRYCSETFVGFLKYLASRSAERSPSS